MRNRLVFSLSLVLAVACGEKKGESEPPDSKEKTPTGKVDDNKTGEGAESGSATPDKPEANADLKAKCESSCLLLTEHKLSALTGKGYCKLCGDVVPTACTAPNPFAADNCDQFDYQRNCIYAANGNKFKKKKWQDAFGKTDWYKPSDDFKEKDLTILENSNIRALRNRTSVCRGKALGPVSNKDIEIVRKFFKRKESGKLKLPKKLYSDGGKASEKSFRSFLMTEGLFELKKYTPITYTEWGPGGKFDKAKFRALSVSTGAASPDCDEENDECEGFEWLEMLLDSDGNVVALGVSAAACPFLYAASDDKPLKSVGEVLRNINRRWREGTEARGLEVAGGCRDSVSIRIAEEKRERTYLDSVSLSIGTTEIAPRGCADRADHLGATAHCVNDGRYKVLEQDESVDLIFDLPSALRCEPAIANVNGYYTTLDASL